MLLRLKVMLLHTGRYIRSFQHFKAHLNNKFNVVYQCIIKILFILFIFFLCYTKIDNINITRITLFTSFSIEQPLTFKLRKVISGHTEVRT